MNTERIRRILVVTGDHHLPDATKRGGHYNEEDLITHEAMVNAFQSMPEYVFEFCTSHDALLETLRARAPQLVVNFCDTGFHNVATMELHLPAYLELLRIPYTGAPPAAMVIAYDKAIVRSCARGLGVAVPDEFFLSAEAHFSAWPERYPALIKPNAADGSVGITANAVVSDRAQAVSYVQQLRHDLPGCDLLIQEYLPGPEYGIGLIGNPGGSWNALPALEVDFSSLPSGLHPILSYESKAIPDSPYWTDIRFRRARLPPMSEQQMVDDAKRLFRRLQLRDYARFDFRADGNGVIKLMEVNPNPAWANDGKLAFMASFAEIEYSQMLRMIIEAAIHRVQQMPLHAHN